MKKSDIKYLSFEGGGGKGNAYVGAIASLEQQGILKFTNNKLTCNIRGISGSSAGAITAFLLGSGYSYLEISHSMQANDFNRFFDDPAIGEYIIAGKDFSTKESSILKSRIQSMPNWLMVLLASVTFFNLAENQINIALLKENTILASKLKKNLKKYLVSLGLDWGLFTGKVIQEKFFESLLQFKMYCISKNIKYDPKNIDQFLTITRTVINKMSSPTFKPCTFKEHYNIFNIELAFTSVNFKTENIGVFSYKTTPDFPISTAVRMSMSLPLIFKPVIINQESLKLLNLDKDFEGFWVDGGLFDNAPVRVFNDISSTVLLRLGNRIANNSITNLIDFIKTYLKIGVMGSGSGQVNPTSVSGLNVIELDVSGLSLLKFNLEQIDFIDLANRNKKIVDDFFQAWQ